MGPALTAPTAGPATLVRLPQDSPSAAGVAAVLEPAIVACEAAIAYRVREGTRPPGGGLLTALVDAIEVGQTVLDLARRGSPLLPAGLGFCLQAFGRAEEACRARGDGALRPCADALAQAGTRLDVSP